MPGCPTNGHFRAKTTKNAFLPLNWPFVGRPDNHISRATSLSYTWVSSTDPRTIFWNFVEKMLKIGGFEKLTFLKQLNSNVKNSKKIFFSLSFLLKCLTNSWVAYSILMLTLIFSGGIDLCYKLYIKRQIFICCTCL